MSTFFEWLEGLNAKDSRVRAVLRRSLAFDPGGYVPAFPYVEPFVKNETNEWRRSMHYLAAGLWATHWREGRPGQPLSLGNACAVYRVDKGSSSTEQRFIALLDADKDQLAHRLRQMITLLKDYPIDFNALLRGLLLWANPRKPTQNSWARDFYRSANIADVNDSITLEEEAQ